MKLSKVYVVRVNYPIKRLASGLFCFGKETIDHWVLTAIFSTREKAEKYVVEPGYSYQDEARGCRISEYEIDRES